MRFYASVFPNSKVLSASPMIVRARLDGQDVMGLNGGPQFAFTEAFSFLITCETQEDVDRYWSALTAGGLPEARDVEFVHLHHGVHDAF